MPERAVVSRALADLLGVLGHPNRVRIIEELRETEKDVNSLQHALGISHSGVSQHLSVLRAHHIVSERRAGRHVFYHLCQPDLARWLMEGTNFLTGAQKEMDGVRSAIETVRAVWSATSTGAREE